MAMKLVNMKVDPKEREKRTESVLAEQPQYPYGLCLRLEQDTMKKLGLTKLPAVGKPVMITALADVTSVSEDEYQTSDGKTETRQNVTLQITDFGMAGVDDLVSTEDKLYKG